MHAEPTKPRPVSAFRSWHNHMRADHPKLWHPIRITIVVITVWWILFCLVLAPTDNPAAIVWTIIEIAVLLLSPFFPKSMSLLFLIMSQSGPWLIPGADVNSLPGILYTFGMLAYETNNLVALLLLAYSIGDQLFRQLVLDTSRSNPRGHHRHGQPGTDARMRFAMEPGRSRQPRRGGAGESAITGDGKPQSHRGSHTRRRDGRSVRRSFRRAT